MNFSQCDFAQLTGQRHSCRDYDPNRPVSREDIAACLEAARLAPSACNSQPWLFAACVGEAAQAAAIAVQQRGMNTFAVDAPCLIVVYEGEARLMKSLQGVVENNYYQSIDIGIATAHIVLAAEARGLSTCIMGMFDEAMLQQLIKTDKRIRLVIALGYAAADEQPPDKRRRPAEEVYRIIGA